MEETKLLRALIVFLVSVFVSNAGISLAGDAELQWVNDIAEQGQEMSITNFKEIMHKSGVNTALRDQLLKPRPHLQIFISSSMPRQLLTAYAKEAKHYGGVLVLRGLPGGSMRKLSDLVMEISSDDSAAMQIDDEAFAAYEINVVPAVVLSKPAAIFGGKSMSAKFDKVTGNITIKAALELFKTSGDMCDDARGLAK